MRFVCAVLVVGLIGKFECLLGSEFNGLGSLSGTSVLSDAYDISTNGQVIVGQSNREAFRWDAGNGIIGLGSPEPPIMWPDPHSSSAHAVSADGGVIVGTVNAGGRIHGFHTTEIAVYWEPGVALDEWADVEDWDFDTWQLESGGIPNPASRGLDINERGDLAAAWVFSAIGEDAMSFELDTSPKRWDTFSGGSDFVSVAISPDARFGAATMWFSQPESFGDTIVGMVPLGSPHIPLESLEVTNNRVVVGSAAVGDGSGIREASRWSPETGLQLLGRLRETDTESVAFDLTEDGKTIIGRSSAEQVFDLPEDLRDVDSVAFLWTEARGMMNLQDMLSGDYGLGTQLAGWQLKAARGITPDGARIVGSGTNPEGFLEAFLVDLTLNTPAADTNFDGRVDLTDFDTLKANFATGAYNAPAFRAQGNFNADAVVDLKDFALLKAEFGPQVNPVPEPSACWLFAAGLPVSVLAWRRRGGPGVRLATRGARLFRRGVPPSPLPAD